MGDTARKGLPIVGVMFLILAVVNFLQGDNWHKGAEIAEQLAADAARLLAGDA